MVKHVLKEKSNLGRMYYQKLLSKGIVLDYCSSYDSLYATMLVMLYDQSPFDTHYFLDIGCSCGSLVKAIKEFSCFDGVVGIDNSKYLIDRGIKSLNLDSSELKLADARKLPISDNQVTLLHCKLTLEQIRPDRLPHVLQEMYRVLSPNGLAFISVSAIQEGQTEELFSSDPLFKTIKTVRWWGEIFVEYGFKRNFKTYMEYLNSKINAKGSDTFYDLYHNKWSVFILTKGDSE